MPGSDPLQVRFIPHDASDALESAWRELEEATPGVTAFGRRAFAVAAAESLGYGLEFCVGHTEDGTLEGAVACYVRSVGPFRRVVVPPFVQYTPVLLRRPPDEHAVHRGTSVPQRLLSEIGTRFDAVALHLQPELQDMRPASWAGFRVQPLYTYRVALSEAGSLFDAWSDNVQRQFRKFVDVFQVDEDPDQATSVIALCGHAYGRHGRKLPVSAAALGGLVRMLIDQGLVRVFVLRGASGSVEAGIVVLHDDQTAHYWIAGSRPGPAMTVLLGKVLHSLSDSGIHTFDFVGANTPSIAEFKRRFGPELVPYFRVEQYRSWGVRALDAVRRRSG